MNERALLASGGLTVLDRPFLRLSFGCARVEHHSIMRTRCTHCGAALIRIKPMPPCYIAQAFTGNHPAASLMAIDYLNYLNSDMLHAE